MKEQLQRYMQTQGLTQGQIAKAIGKSITTVSQYLKGNYNGKTDEIDDAVARLLQREKDKVVERRFNGEFVETYAAQRCLDAIYTAHAEGEIVVIVGAAGLGKTQALKHYVSQNPETLFIEVNPSFNPKVLLKKLCRQAGLSENGVNYELFDRITEKLGEGRLIVVDEAELLNTKCLEYLRRIHDLTGCGLVMAGMPKLIVNLKGVYGDLAQLYSRSGVLCDLQNALEKEDIDMLAEQGLGTGEFNDLLYKVSKGNARRLNKLMRGVIRVAEMHGKPISEALINRYAEMLIN
ncbi:AAA family ATPase [Avibacterium paragallinarum]|uniref:AAA family ATPase n=1 Tax=Avibacterium paragallinarum TaxID=728 RepID=UPI00397D8148